MQDLWKTGAGKNRCSVEFENTENMLHEMRVKHVFWALVVTVAGYYCFEQEFLKLVESGYIYFVVDLNAEEIKLLSNLKEAKNILLISVRSKENKLRNDLCNYNLFHIPPSHNILADALTQFLVKKRWKKWLLI